MTALDAARPSPALLAEQAVEAGARALAGGDARGWRDALERTVAVDDPHVRLHARKLLAQAALTAPAHDGHGLAQLFLAVAQGLLDVLEDEPAEPGLLELCGVACFELRAVDAARALFEAAVRLDPELEHGPGNLAACVAPVRPLHLPPRLDAGRAALADRAALVASRARPAEGLTLSLCMIVKDEAEMLPRCLAAVAGVVDQLVVVDTGSSDDTVAIARSFGAEVLHHAWDGDFSAARNVALEAATGDWVLSLDADEVLVEEDADGLRALLGRTWREAFYLVEINHLGELGDGAAATHSALRLWRNRPTTRFDGRIHEQIAQHFPAYLPERIEQSPVRIEHFGYLGVVRQAKDKARRNIELLERQRAEGAGSPFLDFNLGSEHLAAGDPVRARACFAAAWDVLTDDPVMERYGFVPSLAARYVRTLRMVGDPGTDRLAEEVLRRFPAYTDVVLEQALHALARGDLARSVVLLERCLAMGDAPAQLSPTVGAGDQIARVQLAEVLLALGREDDAERHLVENLARHPGFLGTVGPLADLRLRSGRPPAEVVAEIHAGVAEATPSVRFLLAASLHERGAAAEAQAELEAVVAAQPSNGYARVALAETLLSQGELEAAAATAAAVADDAPAAGAALRCELFCLVVLGRPEGVPARAGEGLPEAEAAVFAAWCGQGGVPLSGVQRCATMLEALGRLEAYEAFEALAHALQHGTVPWRQVREVLARTYLRTGYLESAADEWIAVCRDAPRDVAALRGLAEVADRRGFDEDAAALRAQAELLAA